MRPQDRDIVSVLHHQTRNVLRNGLYREQFLLTLLETFSLSALPNQFRSWGWVVKPLFPTKGTCLLTHTHPDVLEYLQPPPSPSHCFLCGPRLVYLYLDINSNPVIGYQSQQHAVQTFQGGLFLVSLRYTYFLQCTALCCSSSSASLAVIVSLPLHDNKKTMAKEKRKNTNRSLQPGRGTASGSENCRISSEVLTLVCLDSSPWSWSWWIQVDRVRTKRDWQLEEWHMVKLGHLSELWIE